MGDVISSMADLCNFFSADDPTLLNKRIYKGTDCGASISVQIGPPEEFDTEVFGGYVHPMWLHNGDDWSKIDPEDRLLAFTIQTIVEGSDVTVDSDPFVPPVKTSDVQEWIDHMELEAEYLWQEANAEEDEIWN